MNIVSQIYNTSINNNLIFKGFYMGFIHVITGPDHMIAISNFCINSIKTNLNNGFFWGLGHCFGIIVTFILLCYANYLFNKIIFILNEYDYLILGFFMIFLGLNCTIVYFYKCKKKNKQNHYLIYCDTKQEIIFYENKNNELEQKKYIKKWNTTIGSFFIGTIHGMIGPRGLITFVIPIFKQHTMMWTFLLYSLSFFIATILTMVLFCFMYSYLLKYISIKIKPYIPLICSILSIFIGLLFLLKIMPT